MPNALANIFPLVRSLGKISWNFRTQTPNSWIKYLDESEYTEVRFIWFIESVPSRELQCLFLITESFQAFDLKQCIKTSIHGKHWIFASVSWLVGNWDFQLPEISLSTQVCRRIHINSMVYGSQALTLNHTKWKISINTMMGLARDNEKINKWKHKSAFHLLMSACINTFRVSISRDVLVRGPINIRRSSRCR